MKKLLFVCATAIGLVAGIGSTSAAKAPKTDYLLVGGSGWNKIGVIDKVNGALVWSHDIPAGGECNTVRMVGRNKVLYSYNQGAQLIDCKTHRVLWNYDAPEGSELQSVGELPGGGYYVAMCGSPSRILEFDKKNLKTGVPSVGISFDTGIQGVHSQFRQVTRTAQGTYLVPLMGKGEVWEISRTPGPNVLRKVSVPGSLFSLNILDHGNWLVSCGDAHRLVEVNAQNGDIDTVASGTVDGVRLLFVAQTYVLPNGHILVSNWGGHARGGSQPKLFEFDPSTDTVVWRLEAPEESGIGMISTLYPFSR